MNEKHPISEIDALTYPRLNLNNHSLDDNLPELMPELTLGQEYVPLKQLRGGAGALGRLPTEILQEILFQLDLQTLTDFRLVNRRAWELTAYLAPIPRDSQVRVNCPACYPQDWNGAMDHVRGFV